MASLCLIMNGRTEVHSRKCKLWGTWHVNGAKIQKSDSTKFRYCPIISYAIIKFNLATEIAKEMKMAIFVSL